MIDSVLYILADVAKYVAILLLGCIYGLPVMLLGAFGASKWASIKKAEINNEEADVFEDIERKEITLSTGINYDFYESKKSEGQTILFLHGFPDSASSWRPLMTRLAKDGYHCLAPNQRGYGRSSKPLNKEVYDIKFLTADIASFVEKKANGKSVTLIIHDWGGAIGFAFARSYPEMVEKIVGINSPSIQGMHAQFKSNPRQLLASYYIFFFQLPYLPEFVFSANDYAVIKLLMAKIGTPISEVNRCIRGIGVRDDPRTLTCAINYYRANMAQNFYQQLKANAKMNSIHKETLILWGDKDRALTKATPDYEKQFITGNFRVVHFPDGNHNFFHSHVNECYSEISQFMKQ